MNIKATKGCRERWQENVIRQTCLVRFSDNLARSRQDNVLRGDRGEKKKKSKSNSASRNTLPNMMAAAFFGDVQTQLGQNLLECIYKVFPMLPIPVSKPSRIS